MQQRTYFGGVDCKGSQPGLEKPRFWGKVFSFRGFYAKEIRHKIMTQEEHPIHHASCYIIFFKL